MKKSRRY